LKPSLFASTEQEAATLQAEVAAVEQETAALEELVVGWGAIPTNTVDEKIRICVLWACEAFLLVKKCLPDMWDKNI